MYKRILVPLDGSPRAEKVLPHVEGLARSQEAELILLHVIEPPAIAVPISAPAIAPAAARMASLDDILIQAEDQAKIYLHQTKVRLEKEGISCSTRIDTGNIVQKIVDTADQQDVDLVAMSSHGRSGLGTAFFGSVAVSVLHRIERPILLIRANDDSS